MGGTKFGVLGFDTPRSGGESSFDDVNRLGGGDEPGPIGLDGPIRLDVSRTIAKVIKDWDPPNPTTTPEIVIRAATLEAAARQLNTLAEWGQAGGRLRTDEIPRGNSTDLTAHLHGNLVYRLPRWSGYDQASRAAKDEWDRMFKHLRAHEDRHLADQAEVAEWWNQNGHRFATGVRHFMGQPPNRSHCIKVLRNGYQRQRITAAYHLCLINPGTPLFEWRAPASRQQGELAQLT